MAKKKSALSKGYRKSQQKKPFLTKKEIIALIIIVVVVIAAFIIINNLPDGYIGDSQVQEGDILSYGTTKVRDRYLKLGTINELDGFTRTDSKAETTAMVNYTFNPDDESNVIDYITVGGSPLNASELTESMVAAMPGYGYEVSEVQETEIQGYTAYVFGSTYSPSEEEATEETAEEATEEVAEEAAEETAEEVTEEAAEETAEEATEEAAEETAEEVTEEAAEEATEETAEEATEETTEEATEEIAEEATEEAAEEDDTNTYSQDITVYVDCGNDHTLAMHIMLKGEDDSFFIADDALIDFVTPYTDAFTMIEKEETK